MEVDLRTLSYHFKTLFYSYENYVFKEGSLSNGFFVVKKGEFKLYKQYKSSLIEISTLEVGETFGEDEYHNQKMRVYSAVCKSSFGQVYYMSKADFNKRMRQSHTFKIFKDIVQQKFQFRNQRFEN